MDHIMVSTEMVPRHLGNIMFVPTRKHNMLCDLSLCVQERRSKNARFLERTFL